MRSQWNILRREITSMFKTVLAVGLQENAYWNRSCRRAL